MFKIKAGTGSELVVMVSIDRLLRQITRGVHVPADNAVRIEAYRSFL